MLKILILIALSFNIAFAKSRFTDVEKQKFVEEVKRGVDTIGLDKRTNKKEPLDYQKIKPEIIDILESLVERKKITNEEMKRIEKSYEDLIKDSKTKSDKSEKSEEKLVGFIINQFDEINKTSPEKRKENAICNNADCEDGLYCALAPIQETGLKCKSVNSECKDDKDCCSSTCSLDEVSKQKKCEAVSKCYKPLALGQSCLNNPICAVGICSEYDSQTLGIGECTNNGSSCKINSDCCSNSCNDNKCTVSFICKDCTSNGKKPVKGKKCCEGLYLNDKGICVPDLPPIVIPQVNYPHFKKIINILADIIIPSANAAEVGNSEGTKSVQINITRKSNFVTCDIQFKDDFFNELKKANLFNSHLAMLSFDYVMLGQGTNDYWTSSSDQNTSIYGRLNSIAKDNKAQRAVDNKKFDDINQKLTCMCLDSKGYNNLTDPVKKTFFQTSCTAEYAKYLDPATNADQLEGDASGIKGKRLLVQWTKYIKDFDASLLVTNNEAFMKLSAVRDWTQGNAVNWGNGKLEQVKVFHYWKRVWGFWGGLFAVLTGVGLLISIFGSSGTGSGLLLAVSLLSGGISSVWVVDSLKGAWQEHPPVIRDIVTDKDSCNWRPYKCEEHDVYLDYYSNNICRTATNANACIKNFMALYPNPDNTSGKPSYIIDPWVPFGVDRNLLTKNIYLGKNYAESLNTAFETGKNYIISTKSKSFSSKQYAQFGLRFSKPADFVLSKNIITEIKNKAKKFAIDEKVFQESDTENLNAFADYAYEFHFVRPKLSKSSEISYPLVGLLPYLEFMSNGVAANIAVGAGIAAGGFSSVYIQHLQDYHNTLALYPDSPINQLEATSVQAELDNQIAFNSLVGTAGTSSLNTNVVNAIGKSNGTSGGTKDGVTLGADQKAYLNAIGSLRNVRKTQLKSLENFNKAVATNGDSDRAAKIAAASKSFGKSFTGSTLGSTMLASNSSSSSGSRSGGSLFGTGGIDGLKSDDKPKLDDTSKSKKLKNNLGSFNSINLNSGAGNRSSSTNASGGDQKAAEGAEAAAGGNSASDEDARRLAEAIEARNKGNQEKYQSKEEQTIFEKVTNAYIRNYDKVLVRKKDKEIIEKK